MKAILSEISLAFCAAASKSGLSALQWPHPARPASQRAAASGAARGERTGRVELHQSGGVLGDEIVEVGGGGDKHRAAGGVGGVLRTGRRAVSRCAPRAPQPRRHSGCALHGQRARAARAGSGSGAARCSLTSSSEWAAAPATSAQANTRTQRARIAAGHVSALYSTQSSRAHHTDEWSCRIRVRATERCVHVGGVDEKPARLMSQHTARF
jgi:hypothetical protein